MSALKYVIPGCLLFFVSVSAVDRVELVQVSVSAQEVQPPNVEQEAKELSVMMMDGKIKMVSEQFLIPAQEKPSLFAGSFNTSKTSFSTIDSEFARGTSTGDKSQSEAKACILALVVSFRGHASRWSELAAWASKHTEGACGDALILTASTGDEEEDKRPVPEVLPRGVLRVGGLDDWVNLPEKMLRAHHAVATLPELSKYTHVLKLDDTDMLQMLRFPAKPLPNTWKGLPTWSLEWLEKRTEARLASNPERPLDYCGPRVMDLIQDGTWHIKHTAEVHLQCPGNYWCDRGYDHPRRDTYCNGGDSYMVSRRAVLAIADAWDIKDDALKELFHTELYEDVVVSQWLKQRGIVPEPFDTLGNGVEKRVGCDEAHCGGGLEAAAGQYDRSKGT